MAIDNIAEKCQRLHTTPVESMDVDSKLKIIQVSTVVTLLLEVSVWLSHSSFGVLSAQGPASYFRRSWHCTQDSKSLQKILKKKEKIVVHRVLHLFSGSQTLDEDPAAAC